MEIRFALNSFLKAISKSTSSPIFHQSLGGRASGEWQNREAQSDHRASGHFL